MNSKKPIVLTVIWAAAFVILIVNFVEIIFIAPIISPDKPLIYVLVGLSCIAILGVIDNINLDTSNDSKSGHVIMWLLKLALNTTVIIMTILLGHLAHFYNVDNINQYNYITTYRSIFISIATMLIIVGVNIFNFFINIKKALEKLPYSNIDSTKTEIK